MLVKQRYEKYQSTYKLILMEYSLPELNGTGVTIFIRDFLSRNDPTLKQPYVVCLTSFTASSFKKDAKLAGMDYFQPKPIFKQGILKILKLANMI